MNSISYLILLLVSNYIGISLGFAWSWKDKEKAKSVGLRALFFGFGSLFGWFLAI